MTVPQYDPAWLERMYNNRALVPDHMDYLQRWAQDSAQVRARQPCVLDIAYGPGAGETLDVFPSLRPSAKRVPVLVFIHGGYWRSLDKSDHSFIAPPFTQAGFCVVVVNYALCPGTPEAPVTIPHIVRQMEKALDWVWRNIGEHGGRSGPHHGCRAFGRRASGGDAAHQRVAAHCRRLARWGGAQCAVDFGRA